MATTFQDVRSRADLFNYPINYRRRGIYYLTRTRFDDFEATNEVNATNMILVASGRNMGIDAMITAEKTINSKYRIADEIIHN